MARRAGPRGGDDTDRAHMRRCLELAEQYRGRTAPNPIVGSVIVSPRGEVIAEGAHRGPGHDHAEIAALKQLGGSAPGATLYVNLEPCNHFGRTPPCAPAVRDAGVARVVIGMLDPIESHGGGAALLRRAKIAVTTGVLEAECARANAPFVTLAEQHRPRFTLKAGITLDGKIATVGGQSKWITSEQSRADGNRLRDTHDAILVGIGTVLADDPWLTARTPGARDPVRIVLDSQLRTPPTARLLKRKGGAPRVIVACGPRAPKSREVALTKAGAEVWRLAASKNGRVELYAFARALGDAGLASVLVEGGGEVHAALLKARYADELVIYLAPIVVGGPAKSWVGGAGIAGLVSAYKFVLDPEIANLGGDLRITATRAPADD